MNFRQFQERLQAMRSDEFEQFLTDVLRESGLFVDVRRNEVVGKVGADVVAIENSSPAPTTWLFEAKAQRLVPREAVFQLESLQNAVSEKLKTPTRAVLAVTGPLSKSAQLTASNHSIDVWDSLHFAKFVKPQTLIKYFGDVLDAPGAQPSPTKQAAFSSVLEAMPKGTDDALAFQRLVSDIFELLFCPPLERPRLEISDLDGRNRRDMIFENTAPGGFWGFTRETYSAHYVVVDAKNNTDPIEKRSVLDIAHYLKPYGCGMFGILVTRMGASDGAMHAIKEQWIGGQKMIVVLSDEDVHEMLRIHSAGSRPEEIVRDRIAAFRMSL